ncbi:MAG: thioredoxin family protein [Mycobacterium sp.]|uniref:thioredoxin family protein n=1 Tax=Mycobacterium sp. TaxID=1785 RepID=UPI002638A3BD|nr:thioredoxin family protein [Mycobacterium sp.]MDI3313660.1 thioredoxin family protein [Mycobacterium sp.]
MIAAIVAIVSAGALSAAVGWLLTRRSGQLRETVADPGPGDVDTASLGLSDSGPTVVHFSAPWCGPCALVRRVVSQVCGDLGDVAHVEVDLQANPLAARQLSVLSIPTTVIFDVNGRPRYRAVGVPTADDLRSALQPLLT